VLTTVDRPAEVGERRRGRGVGHRDDLGEDGDRGVLGRGAPRSRPIGERSLANASAGTPASRRAVRRRSSLRREPMAPTKPAGDTSAAARTGRSTFGSWLSTQRASAGAQSRSARSARRPFADDRVGVGEPFLGGEDESRVEHRHPEAGRRAEPAERAAYSTAPTRISSAPGRWCNSARVSSAQPGPVAAPEAVSSSVAGRPAAARRSWWCPGSSRSSREERRRARGWFRRRAVRGEDLVADPELEDSGRTAGEHVRARVVQLRLDTAA
jgi:hypothetical protein